MWDTSQSRLLDAYKKKGEAGLTTCRISGVCIRAGDPKSDTGDRTPGRIPGIAVQGVIAACEFLTQEIVSEESGPVWQTITIPWTEGGGHVRCLWCALGKVISATSSVAHRCVSCACCMSESNLRLPLERSSSALLLPLADNAWITDPTPT